MGCLPVGFCIVHNHGIDGFFGRRTCEHLRAVDVKALSTTCFREVCDGARCQVPFFVCLVVSLVAQKEDAVDQRTSTLQAKILKFVPSEMIIVSIACCGVLHPASNTGLTLLLLLDCDIPFPKLCVTSVGITLCLEERFRPRVPIRCAWFCGRRECRQRLTPLPSSVVVLRTPRCLARHLFLYVRSVADTCTYLLRLRTRDCSSHTLVCFLLLSGPCLVVGLCLVSWWNRTAVVPGAIGSGGG